VSAESNLDKSLQPTVNVKREVMNLHDVTASDLQLDADEFLFNRVLA